MRSARPAPEDEAASYQVVYRSSDKFAFQTIADLLAADGIPVVKSGQMTGAAVGVGDHLLTQRLEVPPQSVERALQLIRDFESSTAFRDDDEAHDDEELPRRKKLLIAGVLPFVLPLLAAGLLYAEQRPAALLLTLLEWLAFVANTGGYFPGLFLLLKVAEALLAIEGVRQLNRPARVSTGRQLLITAAALACISPVAAVLNRHAAQARAAIARTYSPGENDLEAQLRQLWRQWHREHPEKL